MDFNYQSDKACTTSHLDELSKNSSVQSIFKAELWCMCDSLIDLMEENSSGMQATDYYIELVYFIHSVHFYGTPTLFSLETF